MFKWLKKNKNKVENNKDPKLESRLEQMKKNPYKRVDSHNMSEIEKMDQRGYFKSEEVCTEN